MSELPGNFDIVDCYKQILRDDEEVRNSIPLKFHLNVKCALIFLDIYASCRHIKSDGTDRTIEWCANHCDLVSTCVTAFAIISAGTMCVKCYFTPKFQGLPALQQVRADE
jgi:hypothetical protein